MTATLHPVDHHTDPRGADVDSDGPRAVRPHRAARYGLLQDLERPSQVFSNLTPNWYASIMGTGIVAVAAATLHYQFPGLHTAAIAVWAIAGVMLVALTAALLGAPPWASVPIGLAGFLVGGSASRRDLIDRLRWDRLLGRLGATRALLLALLLILGQVRGVSLPVLAVAVAGAVGSSPSGGAARSRCAAGATSKACPPPSWSTAVSTAGWKPRE